MAARRCIPDRLRWLPEGRLGRGKNAFRRLTIRCRENGPLVIQGAIRVVDHLGNAFALPGGKDTFALCRWGQSEHKPFCDGMHKKAGFQGAIRRRL